MDNANLVSWKEHEINMTLFSHFQFETKNRKDNQSRVVNNNSCSQFSESCTNPLTKINYKRVLENWNLHNIRSRFIILYLRTYEPFESRAKTNRSPSLMSSKTLQPSQVTLGFRTESSWRLSWDIPFRYLFKGRLILRLRI